MLLLLVLAHWVVVKVPTVVERAKATVLPGLEMPPTGALLLTTRLFLMSKVPIVLACMMPAVE